MRKAPPEVNAQVLVGLSDTVPTHGRAAVGILMTKRIVFCNRLLAFVLAPPPIGVGAATICSRLSVYRVGCGGASRLPSPVWIGFSFQFFEVLVPVCAGVCQFGGDYHFFV